MSRVHILDGKGLASAVRKIQEQVVLFYPSYPDRSADIPAPWLGATTLCFDGNNALSLESWDGTQWVKIVGSGGGGGGSSGGVTDHGALTGLADDDHPQYLRPVEVVAGAQIAVDTTTTPGSVIITNTAPGMDVPTMDARYVNVGGDHMTGTLTIDTGDLVVDAGHLYVDDYATFNNDIVQNQDRHANLGFLNVYNPAVFDDFVTLAVDPVAPMQAVTKQYADAFLKPAEVLAGSNVTVDTTTTPGSVIVGANPSAAGEWLWNATAMTTDPGTGYIASDLANALTATNLVINKTSAQGLGILWVGSLTTGDAILVAANPATNGLIRFVVVGAATDQGTFWKVPVAVVPVPGQLEPAQGVRVRTFIGIGSGGGATGGISQGDADLRFVNVTGDTMTGSLTISSGAAGTSVLSAGRVDIKDMSPGGTSYATQRWYHDNNTDHMAASVLSTATPGLEFSDSRGGGVLLRIAKDEPLQAPNITAAGVVTGNRIDVKDPTPGTGGYASQRFYHDNNVDHMAISVPNTPTPGLEFFDSRDNISRMRIAKDEKVKFPALGHEHKHHICVQIGGATPVTAWTQLPLGAAVYENSGTMTWQANPGGVLIPEAGYYCLSGFIMNDRTLANLSCSLKFGALNVALNFQNWSPIANRTHISCIFYANGVDWVTINAQTSTPCWIGGQPANEDRLTIVSLF